MMSQVIEGDAWDRRSVLTTQEPDALRWRRRSPDLPAWDHRQVTLTKSQRALQGRAGPSLATGQ
jgi:hypothetical protein